MDIALDSGSKGRGFESHCDRLPSLYISFFFPSESFVGYLNSSLEDNLDFRVLFLFWVEKREKDIANLLLVSDNNCFWWVGENMLS